MLYIQNRSIVCHLCAGYIQPFTMTQFAKMLIEIECDGKKMAQSFVSVVQLKDNIACFE